MSSITITEAERDAWRGFRRISEIISGRITQEITRATGLSGPDFGILMQLDQVVEGVRRQRDLQAFLEWDKPRISHQLTRMSGRGLIERESSEAKAVMIRMTAEGRAQLAVAKPIHAKALRDCFLDHLSPDEVLALVAITGKLRLALVGPSD